MSSGPQQKVLAIISVQGRDQKGVVAQFATFVAERGINIEDLEQRVVRGIFVMDMLVDLREMSIGLDQLIPGLLEVGKKMGMEVRVTPQRQGKNKRVAVLVSKEPHCLERILSAVKGNELNGEIVGVLSNPSGLGGNDQGGRDCRLHFRPAGRGGGQRRRGTWSGLRKSCSGSSRIWWCWRGICRFSRHRLSKQFEARIINIHPSLLPFFRGRALLPGL